MQQGKRISSIFSLSGLTLLLFLGLVPLYRHYTSSIALLPVDQLLPSNISNSADTSSVSIHPNTRITLPGRFENKALWLIHSSPGDAQFVPGRLQDHVDRMARPAPLEPVYKLEIAGLGKNSSLYTYRSGSSQTDALLAKAIVAPADMDRSTLIQELSSLRNYRHLFFGWAVTLLAISGFISFFGWNKGVKNKVISGIICVLCIVSFFSKGAAHSLDFGVKIIDQDVAAFIPAASKYDELGNKLIANLPKAPAIQSPLPGTEINGTLDAHIFTSDAVYPVDEPLTSILGGLLAYIQRLSPQLIHNLLWSVPIVIVIFVTTSFLLPVLSGLLVWITILWSAFISLTTSLYYAHGWDELFINLRHSYSLAYFGRYSYNFYENVEATVDFIPFFAAGILGMIGLPLIDSILAITLSGNLLVMAASYLLTQHFTGNKKFSVGVCCLTGIFPCLLLVAGTGFTATFFSGWTLLGLYFYLVGPPDKRIFGTLLLATLTLVRTEGILLAGLAFAARFLIVDAALLADRATRRSIIRNSLISGLIMISPFLISCLARYLYFGLALPVPIIFKNANGDIGYLLQGVLLLKQAISSYYLDIVVVVMLVAFLCAASTFPRKGFIALLAALLPFALSYYSGGGDWFPIEWNRYMMPLTLLIWILAGSALYNASYHYLRAGWFIPFLIVMVIFKDAGELRNGSAFWGQQMRTAESSVARWGRVQLLASFGSFLKNTTDKDTVVASPEMSTIMYFAERNLLDLLGIANYEIASSPLQPLSPGDLMHRKRDPKTLDRHLPGIVALFEMAHLQPNNGAGVYEKEASFLLQTLAFSPDKVRFGYYRVGSYEHLKELGYTHMAIFHKNLMFNYFVHPSILKKHMGRLAELGYLNPGIAQINYTIPTELTRSFSPE